MRISLRRAVAVSAVVAAAAVLSPLATGTAFAGTPHLAANAASAGTSSPSPASGNSDTAWTFLENTGPTTFTCPQDSASEGGNFSTFMTPASTDVSQLPFTAGTPTGSGFTGNLYSTTGSQQKNLSVQAAPGRQAFTGTFSLSAGGNIPPGTIAPGAYKIGIACFDTTDTSPRYPTKFYQRVITVTTDSVSGGSSQFTYQTGAVAAVPTGVSATAGNQSCTVSFTPGGSDPADTSYTVTGTPGGSASGGSSPIIVSGLTNNQAYTFTVTATNAVGTSAPSAASSSCTPVAGARNNVSNLQASVPNPGDTDVTLTWDPPAANTPAVDPDHYSVSWTGPTTTGSPATVAFGTNTYHATALDSGNYTFNVVAIYLDSPTQGTPPQQVTVAIVPNTVLYQQVDVTRPVGALVLTQVCASNGEIPEDLTATPGFPDGVPQIDESNGSHVGAPADSSGAHTPTKVTLGGDPDELAPQYPYPTDGAGNSIANYPTWCSVHLDNAQLVTHGTGAGQYFATQGNIQQITVVDTTDSDEGWDITGVMSEFNSGTDTFSSRQVGWAPQLTDKTDEFIDGDGNTYTPDPSAGDVVPPSAGASATDGLSIAQDLGIAGSGSGLGISIFDARLKLLIPVTANSGTYLSTLTITTA